jgi:prolyl 4-hydroxylase
MRGLSCVRRGLLYATGFYLLQFVLLLYLDPLTQVSVTNYPSSFLTSFGLDTVSVESNAVIQHTVVTTVKNNIESPLSSPVAEKNLGSDLGVPQVIDAPVDSAAIRDCIDRARVYMNEIVAVNSTYNKVRSICKNRKDFCALYAIKGQCDANPGMKSECAPVCQSCEQMDVDIRCKVDPDAVDALHPGDLDRLYEGITTNPSFEQYDRKILSRPSYSPGDTAETADYQLGPWMVLFDNALTDEEADRFIELGNTVGFTRSTQAGKRATDGSIAGLRSSERTSTTAWCFSPCTEDPIVQRVMNRIATITGIAETSYEFIQMLRYDKGQFYQLHNDYMSYQQNRSSGVRLLTFYFYLSDVDEGGGTQFPHLNLTVTPKKGRAVLWPSVLNEDPNSKDSRTDHTALAVTRGVKFGFNLWLHQRDFRGPHQRNCQR